MKPFDIYHHFKGNDYTYFGIALPIREFTGDKDLLKALPPVKYANTPMGEEPEEIALYQFFGFYVIEREVPHVIYEANATKTMWAREVDDFFGYKEKDGTLIKRFSLVQQP